MPKKTVTPGARPRHMNQPGIFQEKVHDSYQSRGKLPEPTVCPQCGAVFHQGRWQWLPKPENAHSELCPACHRIHDRFPNGYVTMEGAFLREHREELLHLARNVEKKEKADHPLKRIMAIDDEEGRVVVSTTDPHLARGIGEALHHAYQGRLDFHYSEEENLLRVHWRR